MSIQQNEIKFRAAAVQSDSAANGGRMTSVEVISGVANNIFPNVYKAERVAGITRYRKVFLHIANQENLAFIAPTLFIDKYTQGDDSVTMFLGTAVDTQASIVGTERLYGSGQLDVALTIGDTSVSVATEGAGLNIIRNGDKIRISDMATVVAATGNDQVVTVSSTPSYSGDIATFDIAETINFNFAAASTRVMSIIPLPDMSTVVDTLVVTTAGSGAYNNVANPILAPNLSAINQSWTLTVTSGGTKFNVTGDTVGSLGEFSIGSDISPANPNLLTPYFTLYVAGKSGTFADGDTITFNTKPNAVGIWLKQAVPAGANNLTGNNFSIGVEGESA